MLYAIENNHKMVYILNLLTNAYSQYTYGSYIYIQLDTRYHMPLIIECL